MNLVEESGMDGTAIKQQTNLQDLRAHLANLEAHGKLTRVSKPMSKDTEIAPLVRWQFRGLDEVDRRGFIFDNVLDAKGRRIPGSVAAGIYASSREIYSIGMGCPVGEVRARWLKAQANLLKPKIVASGAVQEEIHVGAALLEHGGLDEFPIPNFTPGFDVGPYTTASNWVTRDPETGWINVGNYRGQVKGRDRLGVFMSPRNQGWKHWDMRRQQGKPLEAALVIGGPAPLTYASGARIPYGTSEYEVAGSLIGEPLELVRCQTVDLEVPAWAELVIEGRIATDYLEPEAPFGEYTGYMGERVYNCVFEITAITHRKNPIFATVVSQMPPSESSVIRKIATDNLYLGFLRNNCGIPQVKSVAFHEIALDGWGVIQMAPCNPSVAWQALYALAGRNATCGKMLIAVDEDIDPNDMDAVVWALSYRMQPDKDSTTLGNRAVGLDPSGLPPSNIIKNMTVQENFGSVMLINAMRKWDYPPVALPAKEYMERAMKTWQELGLPPLRPRTPWHGYELGNWSERDREEAKWAANGDYHRTGQRAQQERKPADPSLFKGGGAG